MATTTTIARRGMLMGYPSHCSCPYLRTGGQWTHSRRCANLSLFCREIAPEPDRGVDAAVEVKEGDLLVRRVEIVVRQPPTHENRVQAERLREQGDDGD